MLETEPLAIIKVTFDDIPDEFKDRLFIFLSIGLTFFVLVNIVLSMYILENVYNKLSNLKNKYNYYQI